MWSRVPDKYATLEHEGWMPVDHAVWHRKVYHKCGLVRAIVLVFERIDQGKICVHWATYTD